ncbi:thiamine phosphate synthase [Sphingobacterium paludis]|uniref:Thiamine-phosphate synthase n=1 Tax=Sphingobacterium paludis TaxID=1476465 RepID=A0A4R7CZ28_9SPHI|nr:thiamine phosphate synthase [Sphingobacterium paludis]TDS11786.1 thiamine-phosphate pyrophosphorylase [Sphingobacterium paludis]
MPINSGFPYPLYLVISERDCAGRPLLWVAEEAIRGGVDIIQLREKEMSNDAFLKQARALKKLTDKFGIPLVINDAVDIAIAVEAWGVHVGQQDSAPLEIAEKFADRLHIGWSLEDIAQLESEQMAAVDHLGLSPIYATATKTDTITEWGIDGISEVRKMTDKPLIAIGRMHAGNAVAALAAGANSIAVVSSICQAPDPRAASQQLKNLLL